jgi:hypothetical protein
MLLVVIPPDLGNKIHALHYKLEDKMGCIIRDMVKVYLLLK